MGGTETELKLALPRDGLAKLKRLPQLKPFRRGRATTALLRATYFDTPERTLANAGITVRLRSHGGRLIQTVKTAGSRASGLFARREWESEVPGPHLDHALLATTGLPQLQDGDLCAALEPVFTTEVHRSIYHLGGDGWQVELALDDGEIHAGSSRETICEAELELKAGRPEHLFSLAQKVAARLPVRLGAASKSDRGFALAARRAPSAVKSQPVELRDGASVAEGFRAIARNCLHHLLSNEHALLAHGDGEAVHQMRVALRRLRSAIKVFRPLIEGPQLAALTQEIGWLLGALGPARDAAVFVSEILDPLTARFPNHPEVTALRDHWCQQRDDDLARVRAAVADRRFTALLLALGAWIEAGDWCTDPALPGYSRGGEALTPFAKAVLDRLARKMRKSAGKKLRRLTPGELHRVRIHGKRLRYAGEFFAPLFARHKSRTKDYLATLAQLQDCLGAINDIAVAATRLAASHHIGGLAWAGGLAAGWHEARRPGLVTAADDGWAALRRRRQFWR
jgi:inorganic triphosphatase YgiF